MGIYGATSVLIFEQIFVAKVINEKGYISDMMSSRNDLPPPPPPYPGPRASDSDDSSKMLIIIVAVIVIMVAGSVILSAVLYMSLPDGDFTEARGEIIYDEDMSEPENGTAYFTLTLHQPTEIRPRYVVVRVYNSNDQLVTSEVDVDWIHHDGNSARLKSGDGLRISSTHEIYGYRVVLIISGNYFGAIRCSIPSE